MGLGLALAILVPAGLLLGIVVLNRSRRAAERGGTADGSGGAFVPSDSGDRDTAATTSYLTTDSGSWDSGSDDSCNAGDSGGASDGGGSGDGGGDGGGGGCD